MLFVLGVCVFAGLLTLGIAIVFAIPREPPLVAYATSLVDEGTYDHEVIMGLRGQLLHWVGVAFVAAADTCVPLVFSLEPILANIVLAVALAATILIGVQTRRLHVLLTRTLALAPASQAPSEQHDASE